MAEDFGSNKVSDYIAEKQKTIVDLSDLVLRFAVFLR
jgi:hypothetical protein